MCGKSTQTYFLAPTSPYFFLNYSYVFSDSSSPGRKVFTIYIGKEVSLHSNVNPPLTKGEKVKTEKEISWNDYPCNVEGLTVYKPFTPSEDYFLPNRGPFSRIEKRREDGTHPSLSHFFPLFTLLPVTQRILCEKRCCVADEGGGAVGWGAKGETALDGLILLAKHPAITILPLRIRHLAKIDHVIYIKPDFT